MATSIDPKIRTGDFRNHIRLIEEIAASLGEPFVVGLGYNASAAAVENVEANITFPARDASSPDIQKTYLARISALLELEILHIPEPVPDGNRFIIHIRGVRNPTEVEGLAAKLQGIADAIREKGKYFISATQAYERGSVQKKPISPAKSIIEEGPRPSLAGSGASKER